MVPSPSSELTFLGVDGVARAGREWTALLLHLPCRHGEWEGLGVAVNGVSWPVQLRRFGSLTRVVCDWPPSAAGTYEITITGLAAGTAKHRLFIPPAKLSTAQLSTLLTDLDERLPHALVASLRRGGALAGLVGNQPPNPTGAEAELERLRAIVDGDRGLARLLFRIAQDPHRQLREVLWDVPTARARRIDPRQLREALYRDREPDDDGIPLRIQDRRVETTCDVPENRLLRHLHDMVARRLARLSPRLAPQEDQCTTLIQTLADARRRARFLDGVGLLAHPPTQISQVMIHRPDYAHVLSLWRQLMDGLTVQLADSAMDTGLKDVPSLYELWGCLSVIQTVIDAALEQGFQVVAQDLVRPVPGCLLVALSPGGGSAVTLAHADGRRIDLTQQRPFTDRGLWQSVSFTQRPDLVLELSAPGTLPRLMIFDPKYKRDDGNGPQKADIDKMHAYRDAIIHADGGRIVRHAAILYPGPTRFFGPGLSAIGALPGQDAAMADSIRRLLADHLFGA